MARLDAANELAAALRQVPDVHTIEIEEELKISTDARVYRAILNGEKVVIKHFLAEDRARTVTRAKTELDHLETVFGTGECQANRCLLALPAQGILVLSFAPGRRLDETIDRLSGTARQGLLAQSGRWILRYAEGRIETTSFGPRFWLRRLKAGPMDHVGDPGDRDLLARLLAMLGRKTDELHGTPVLKAAVHGDFCGLNAHYHDGVIHGIDIQGESRMAVAREVARFLVWQQIHDDRHGDARRFGIDRADWQALLSSGVLGQQEQATSLPFFVGEQLLTRFASEYRRKRIRANSRAAIEAFLSETW